MSHQNIQVFLRCRPQHQDELRSIVDVQPPTHVRILDKDNYKNYQFDQVFDQDSEQLQVYNTVVEPLIEQVLSGYSCTVFAYGQTGTGKTFTMEGRNISDDHDWVNNHETGIIPRAISNIIDELKDLDDEYSLKVSFLELYNEDTYDLLSSTEDISKLKIFDDANKKGSVIVGGLQEIIVKSKEEIYDIFKRGSLKRQTAATKLNACSSRSHTVFTITVRIKESQYDGKELLKIGKLNLVDLAGSENIGRSGALDKRAREAGNINQSLLTLGRVISALVEKRPHIPYRESKLTRLLQDSLGGKTKTSIIATISPALEDLDDTLSTLDYASKAKGITNKPEMNQSLIRETSYNQELRYSREVEELRERYENEKNELEFKVRNEVAAEFRREVEKIKESYQQLATKDKTEFIKFYEKSIKKLAAENDELVKKLEESSDEIKLLKQSNAEKDAIINEIAKQNETLKVEMSVLVEEFETKEVNYKTKIKELTDINTNQETQLKSLLPEAKPTKVTNKRVKRTVASPAILLERNKALNEDRNDEVNDYPYMSFTVGSEDEDEINQVSPSKKLKTTRQLRVKSRNRLVDGPITASGKKQKMMKNSETPELSPIEKPDTARVITRSKAARKLNY